MLSRREHSQRELLQKLSAKEFDSAEINELLEEFKEKNWQSDTRFAESYSRSRWLKGFGPVRIQLELQARGIDSSINDVLDEQPDWTELLRNLHSKKYGRQAPNDLKERAKRTRFLLYKGYSHEMINQLFNNMA